MKSTDSVRGKGLRGRGLSAGPRGKGLSEAPNSLAPALELGEGKGLGRGGRRGREGPVKSVKPWARKSYSQSISHFISGKYCS